MHQLYVIFVLLVNAAYKHQYNLWINEASNKEEAPKTFSYLYAARPVFMINASTHLPSPWDINWFLAPAAL